MSLLLVLWLFTVLRCEKGLQAVHNGVCPLSAKSAADKVRNVAKKWRRKKNLAKGKLGGGRPPKPKRGTPKTETHNPKLPSHAHHLHCPSYESVVPATMDQYPASSQEEKEEAQSAKKEEEGVDTEMMRDTQTMDAFITELQ